MYERADRVGQRGWLQGGRRLAAYFGPGTALSFAAGRV